MMPPASRTEATPRGVGTGHALPTTEQEIAQEFLEFREAAVRLAERVRDLTLEENDPVEAARADLHMVRSIFGKWSSDVLIALHSLPSAGFEELRRSLNGISPRVLSLKLKELEQSGMVQREILDSHPPRVRYSLTERGWTVAWLSQPVLLYLRFSDSDRRGLGRVEEVPAPMAAPRAETRPATARSEDVEPPLPARGGSRSGRASASRSRPPDVDA
jgi:DNA-binding HxlR family transcriptional regulator